MCDADRAPDSDGACGTATAICDATDGYDSTDRVCVTTGQTAAQCQALSMRVLEGSTCASMRNADRAPDSDGACGTATAICDATDGYDGTDRVCVSTPTAVQCVAVGRLLHSTAANGCVTACLANEASSTSVVGSVAAGTCFSRALVSECEQSGL